MWGFLARERQRRFHDKTKDFTGLIRLATINERTHELWYLTYTDSNVTQDQLDLLITAFVHNALSVDVLI